jgi:ribosomal protein S18 acetylase RimI-like enzyme
MIYFVRTATEKDLPAIRKLLVAAFEETYVPIHGAEKVAKLNEGWNSELVLRSCLKDPAGEFLVADNGRWLGGVAYATPSRSLPKTIGLMKLYVGPGMKREGIGQNLLEEIETCFPTAERLRLEVDVENAGAIAFYQAKGFEQVGRTENCGASESGMPAYIMEKKLTPYG